MKKILIISAFPPNQKTAGQDYTRRLILDLLDKGYSVSLFYSEYPEHKVELPSTVDIIGKFKPTLKNCIKKLNFHPFFTKRFDFSILKKIKEVANEYDYLYFDFSQMHIYSYFIDHPNKILMCHDVIFQKYTRKGKWQLPIVRSSEKRLLKTGNSIITFSEKDCGLIKKEYGLDSISVNFYLKTSRFKYKEESLEDYFCFYGAWNRPENYEALFWFLDEIYPTLRTDIKFCIIGGNLSDEHLNKIKCFNNIKYLGFVDNPVEELARCRALIAPLKKGAGVKVKVIDALTTGCPVIGSDVAFEGIVDNKETSLLNMCSDNKDYAELINNWSMWDVQKRQLAADEFYERYNTNHFPDLLSKGEI